MKNKVQTDFKTGSRVLNQLFAAQSMLHIFPNARRMEEFAAQALKNIPGVSFCSICLRGEEKPLGDTFEAALKLSATLAKVSNKLSPSLIRLPFEENLVILPLLTVDFSFGYVLLSVTDTHDFGFYEPAVSNFTNILAVHLENIEHRSQVKLHHDQLEAKIKERTDELLAEIDRRKLFERSLQLQKNEFEAIFELVPAQIWYKDTRNRFLRVNRQVCEDIGLTKSEIEGHSAEELFPAFAKNFFEDDLEVFNSRQPKLGISEQINTSSGDLRWLHTDKIPVYGDNGEVNGLIAFVTDITERKKAESALRASEQNYREIFNATTEAIFIHDAHTGKILDVNDAMLKIYGYNSKKEVLSGNIGLLSANEDTFTEESAQSYFKKTVAEGPQTFEWLARKKDGTVFWIEIILKKTEIGGENRILAVGRDINERKKAENAMLEAQTETLRLLAVADKSRRVLLSVAEDEKKARDEIKKLNDDLEIRVAERTHQLQTVNKELEAFSYSISHDLRAPLRALDGFARILLEDHSSSLSSEGNRLLKVITENAEKMGHLIDDLLSFSRLSRQEIKFSVINMRDMADSVWQDLVTEEDRGKIEFRLQNIPEAYGDLPLVRQVWINLISNAIKFSARKPNRMIEVGATTEGAENIYFVKDNGAGFDMAYSKKLFAVFQRLHSAKEFEGTGVGLAIVQRIVNRLSGRVWAEGIVKEGATFYFTLPKKKEAIYT